MATNFPMRANTAKTIAIQNDTFVGALNFIALPPKYIEKIITLIL